MIDQARFTLTKMNNAVTLTAIKARMTAKTNANPRFKKSRQARVCENAQANKARDVFRGWQVHHHF